ncbi:MAG: hypothetical protein J4N87_06950 [Chloroflexi bacterium]|nr:hypothetical protein [Chloroflexota bacterium]
MAETPDSHDLDKLTRWHEGLMSASGQGFPVCALFLASGEDNRAHDIFRVYRTAFEKMSAGFHDLVIFGQHGMSTTCAALIPGLGFSSLQIPALVLINAEDSGLVFHTTGLPGGALAEGESEEDDCAVPWRKALESVKRAVAGESELSLDAVKGLDRTEFFGGTLAGTVGEVKIQVESD